jgi:hypothetical protein
VDLRGYDGTDILLPLRDNPALLLGQVKAEVIDSVFFFLETLYPDSHKREGRK